MHHHSEHHNLHKRYNRLLMIHANTIEELSKL